jgi:hypothetical protein
LKSTLSINLVNDSRETSLLGLVPAEKLVELQRIWRKERPSYRAGIQKADNVDD